MIDQSNNLRENQSHGRVAVLLPCHNEAATIGKVVDDFRAALPTAAIYVFDNCCTDETAAIASAHGATVIREPRKGKGFVVESMFDGIDADYYVMVDGDDTYPAEAAPALLAPVMAGQADMAVGARLAEYDDRSFRPLHVMGNGLVRGLINKIFDAKLTDIMSGYRAFNRKVIRRIPVVSAGFEVETELTIQMLYYRLKIVETQVSYRGRPEGSVSKLNTFRDGFRVIWKIFSLFRAFKPLTFFGGVGIVFFVLALLAGAPPIYEYITTGRILRFPLAILATGLMLMSAGSVFLGILLHAVNWRFKELHNVLTRGRENSHEHNI
ncbi:MAG: glycosyltransferase [Planctomycetaceae bacterium]|nr:MAG: glycosyltransferase [Planctomycetaceae bacterium]